MLNLECGGLVGSVEVRPDKKTGLPVLSVQLMNDKGKQIKVRVNRFDDRVSMLKFGQVVELRFENVGYLMSDFGNLTFGCESVKILGSAVNSQSSKVVNG